MPNRRRRKLSTTMSAVAALAVASPCAYFLVYESTTSATPRAEQHEFKPAAVITDLPSEVMSALSQGLSQFGVNVPPVPALTGGTSLDTPGLTTPGLSPTTPGLAPLTPVDSGVNPALTNPALTSPVGVNPNEVPIGGLDPGSDGTYPILGDPSGLGGTSNSSGSSDSGSGGGLIQNVKQLADQFGVSQAIDLIKGLIMQGVQNGAAAPAEQPMAPPV